MKLPDFSKVQRWQWVAGGILVFVSLGAAWFKEHDKRVAENATWQSRYTEQHRRATIADAYAQAASARVVHDSVRVTRTVHRLDTLWKTVPETLRTSADTEIALASLPVLRRSTDSAIASCSEFQISCAEYRRASDSARHALLDENLLLKQRLGMVPPKCQKCQTVLKWAEILGAGYVGYRVGRGR